MELLRFVYPNKIKDISLADSGEICEGVLFVQKNAGALHFNAKAPVVLNGKETTSGVLKQNDVVLIDADKKTALLVIDDIVGSPMTLNDDNEIHIGRKSENSVVLSDRLVSSRHCVLSKKSGVWYIKDLNSTNGTYLNDKKTDFSTLTENSILKIGKYRFTITNNSLRILNADEQVSFNIDAMPVPPTDGFNVRPYPIFSPSPRIIQPLSPLNISIETAPDIGSNPTMGFGGVVLNPQMMAISLGMQALRYALNKRKHSKQEKQRAEIYATYLAQIEAVLQEYAKKQRAFALSLHPDTKSCMTRAEKLSQNLWERHVGDEDFLTVRLGLGKVPSKANITVPQLRLRLQEDEFDKVPQQISELYSQIEDMPIFCDLANNGNCAIIGSRENTIALSHSMIAQLAALHGYDELKIVAVYSKKEREKWEWMRWLPHSMSDDRNLRFMITGNDDSEVSDYLEKIIKSRLENQNQWSFGQKQQNLPHIVFVVSDPSLLNNSPIGSALMMNNPELNISGIFLGQSMGDFPHSTKNVIKLTGTPDSLNISLKTETREDIITTNEHNVPVSGYEHFARVLAPVRLIGMQKEYLLPSLISLSEGLGITDFKEIDIGDYWRSSMPERTLSVPIGKRTNGETFYFDIHQNVHGPHGLVAGGTGSGKSQMAQTWIISMALQFSPKDINFVLVDFKGESLLQPFMRLPHLAGSISNLDKDVSRSFLALESELERRQKLLSTFECNDIIEYLKKRRYNEDIPPMPYLVLIIDEFAEFKQQFPDFTKSLDHLYRGGRSLGLFVILMTQAPSGIVTDQMRANAAFRWCLSVKSDSDSRELLGSNDAVSIRNPGRAYIKSGDTFELIQSFFAGAPTEKASAKESEGYVYSVTACGKRTAFYSEQKKESRLGSTQLDTAIELICDYCKKNHIESAPLLWHNELPEKLDLFSIPEQGEAWSREKLWRKKVNIEQGPKAILGLEDDPAHQQQKTLIHDFWKDGHLALYGMPTSGKTSFLQNMQISLFSGYSPDDIWVYSVDAGGFGMRAVETFPHVGMSAGDDEPESITEIFSILLKELDNRKKLFREFGAGSLSAYIEAGNKKLSTIILFIDNLNLLSASLPNLNSDILKLCREGASFGMYIVFSFSGTGGGISYQISPNIKTIYCLELPDKADYASIVGRPAQAMPNGIIGRGLTKSNPSPLLFQTAIPFSDLSDSKRIAALRSIANDMTSVWQGSLPTSSEKAAYELIPYSTLTGDPLILGENIKSKQPVSLPLKENVSLLISDGAGALTETLQSIIQQAEELSAQIFLFTLSPENYTIDSRVKLISTTSGLDSSVNSIAELLRARQSELKTKPDIKFDPIFVILDDYCDLVLKCTEDTVARLEVFIRLGKDLGLMVIGADTDKNISRCRFGGDILTATMRQGPILLCGGEVLEHKIISTLAFSEELPSKISQTEGFLIENNTPHHIIRMGCK